MEDAVYHLTEDELRAWMDAELVRLGSVTIHTVPERPS